MLPIQARWPDVSRILRVCLSTWKHFYLMGGTVTMDDFYRLAIVGAGLSSLSAINSGIAGEKTIVIDYADTPGGFLKPALPAHGFEEAWNLIESFRMPVEVKTCFKTTAVGLLPAFESGEPHTLIARQRQGTMEIRAR